MIKEALQWIVKLSQEPVKIDDLYYHKDEMKVITPPLVETIDIPSLNGFILFCLAIKNPSDVFICLWKERIALVSRDLKNGFQRQVFASTPIPIDSPAVDSVLKAKGELEKRVPKIECYL